MSTFSPAVADAYSLLRDNLCLHLDLAEELAHEPIFLTGDEITRAAKVIRDLVTVVRGMLRQHMEDKQGNCRFCARTWPCPDVQSIHALLTDPEHEFIRLIERARL